MEEIATITGLEQTLDKLKQLDQKVQNKVLKKACKAGASLMFAVAYGKTPVKSGRMRSHLTVRFSSKPAKGITRATVGVGVKDWEGDAWYATLVLFGHRVGSRKLGNKRKLIPENNFLKKAADAAGEAAANAMIDVIKEGIEENS